MTLTHFSLFSGIGGLDLAAEWAGFRTVGQVEYADYPFRVLRRRFGRLPRWRNIRDVTEDALRRAGITRPTVISGGFPCQPFSVAGKRQGAEDDRYLWPEMLRVVRLARPTWVIGENVAGFVSMALDNVCADLEREGYSCRPLLFPAAGVGAPHKRDRVLVVAHSGGSASGSSDQAIRALGMHLGARDYALCGGIRQFAGEPSEDVAHTSRELLNRGRGTRRRGIESTDCSFNVPDPYKVRCNLWQPERQRVHRNEARDETDPSCGGGAKTSTPNTYSERREERNPAPRGGEAGFDTWGADPLGNLWLAEPSVGRVAAGVPRRVDRLMALGNAVVPQQAFPIFQAIAAIERTCGRAS